MSRYIATFYGESNAITAWSVLCVAYLCKFESCNTKLDFGMLLASYHSALLVDSSHTILRGKFFFSFNFGAFGDCLWALASYPHTRVLTSLAVSVSDWQLYMKISCLINQWFLSWWKTSPHFMNLKGSLPRSQNSATFLVLSSNHPYRPISLIYSNIILPFTPVRSLLTLSHRLPHQICISTCTLPSTPPPPRHMLERI
jgi:hypothetical protein